MKFTLQMKKIIAISIVIVLIFSGIIIYQLREEKPEKKEEPEQEKEIDFRISPHTNQGLIVEVLRIRNRGLLEKMLKIGTSWKQPPSFYYDLNVDGKDGILKGNLGKGGVYTTWDTIGMESCTNFHIEEEQVFSDVKISIKEVISKGILGLRTEDATQLEINVKYDYRTGRWSGADEYGDEDGYGHYLGEKYEVWFNIYQDDYDHDGIPFFIEKNVLGTDPTVDDSKRDPDNDGIPTSWEWKWGYDPHTWDDHENLDPDIDGIENTEEYMMRKYFSNPHYPNMYMETDGMEKKGIFDLPHYLSKEGIQMLVERFAQHGITMVIDDGWPDGPVNGGGETLPFHVYLDDHVGKQTLSFYEHNFADERKGVFRYLIMGYEYSGFICPSEYIMFDTIHVGTSPKDTFKTRKAFTPRYFIVSYTKNILHELGHSLGLVPITFYGNDIIPGDNVRWPESLTQEEYDQYVDNYYSIMNYYYINRDRQLFDYSDGSGGEYDFDDWGNIYLPSFQIDQISYEEPSDDTFDDFEISDEYPGVILEGYEYDKNLTNAYLDDIKSLNFGINDYDYMVFVDTEEQKDARIYAMQKSDSIVTQYVLIGSGNLNKDKELELYPMEIKDEIDYLKSIWK